MKKVISLLLIFTGFSLCAEDVLGFSVLEDQPHNSFIGFSVTVSGNNDIYRYGGISQVEPLLKIGETIDDVGFFSIPFEIDYLHFTDNFILNAGYRNTLINLAFINWSPEIASIDNLSSSILSQHSFFLTASYIIHQSKEVERMQLLLDYYVVDYNTNMLEYAMVDHEVTTTTAIEIGTDFNSWDSNNFSLTSGYNKIRVGFALFRTAYGLFDVQNYGERELKLNDKTFVELATNFYPNSLSLHSFKLSGSYEHDAIGYNFSIQTPQLNAGLELPWVFSIGFTFFGDIYSF